jgi:uncharacterized repeat protein (TIGR03803 family)
MNLFAKIAFRINMNSSRKVAVRRRVGCLRVWFLLPVVVDALGSLMAGRVTAQTFKTLYSFTPSSINSSGIYTNSDGTYPTSLILSGNTCYGITALGGSEGNGTVFKVNTDGTGFSTLNSFPLAYTKGLVISTNTLYGTSSRGGSSGNGTVFKLNTDGTGLKVLHSFTPGSGSYPMVTNVDGAFPSGLVLSGDTLYGTTLSGGSLGDGTVFKVNTDGTGFTNVYSSGGANSYVLADSDHVLYRTKDGPNEQLILSGGSVYGTMSGKASDRILGPFAYGVVFKDKPVLNNFSQNLYTFTIGDRLGGSEVAFSRLVLSGNTLYGTAFEYELSIDLGVSVLSDALAFALNTDGTGFTILHRFNNSDGPYPPDLVSSSNALYGVTADGGLWGNGSLFSISFTPQLTITPAGANTILTWPTNYAGFDYTGYTLQSTTNLASPVWTTNLPAPAVVNGQYTVTNPISGTQQFFRLSQ